MTLPSFAPSHLPMNSTRPRWILAAPLVAALLSGCNCISTGARTAYVVVERPGSSERVSPFTSSVAREQAKPLLDAKHLWVTDDVRGAKWLAVFEVSAETDQAKSAPLVLKRLEWNPAWDPLAVSSPSPFREPRLHPSLALAEANESLAQTQR